MMWPVFEKIQSDFKLLSPGDWFVPVTLKEVDQYQFLNLAVEKGIAGIVCEAERSHVLKNHQVASILVPNLREFLFQEARNKRDFSNLEVVSISGSNGKTTVKELIGCILRHHFQDHSFMSPDNQNTKIALATQILRLPTHCQAAVFEVGARKRGDFQIPLSYLKPTVSALLNIGTAHISEFGSRENLIQEKLSVLNNSWAHSLVVPADDSLIYQTAQKSGKRILSFGYSQNSDVRIQESSIGQLELRHLGQTHKIACKASIAAFEINCAAAAAVALSLSIPWSVIKSALSQFAGVPRRFHKFQWGSTCAVDDAFNASPESMILGLQTLKNQFPQSKALLVLGSMLELGEISQAEHKKIAHEIFKLYTHQPVELVTIGDEAEVLAQELIKLKPELSARHFSNSFEAKSYVTMKKDLFDVIYFKGSKSIQLHKIWESHDRAQ